MIIRKNTPYVCTGGRGKCQGFAGITATFPVKCFPEVCSGHGGHIA